jgi:hypothetical protein
MIQEILTKLASVFAVIISLTVFLLHHTILSHEQKTKIQNGESKTGSSWLTKLKILGASRTV